MCVCGHVCHCVCVFSCLCRIEHTCVDVWKGSSLYRGISYGNTFSLRPEKWLPLRRFLLGGSKSSDSNLATRLQSGNHMCSPASVSLMSNHNRPHTLSTTRSNHSWSWRVEIPLNEHVSKDKLTHSLNKLCHTGTEPHKLKMSPTDSLSGGS